MRVLATTAAGGSSSRIQRAGAGARRHRAAGDGASGRGRVDAANWVWVGCAIAGGVFQTFRNVMQRQLTDRLGTLGATHVRFLYGLPFGLVFAFATWIASGRGGFAFSWAYAGWVLMGALTQIAGTALMLAAMRERSFVVTTAYLKTEPLQIALFGLIFLGERLSLQASLAIVVATAGVVLMSLPGRTGASAGSQSGATGATRARDAAGRLERLRPAALGIASGGMFALAAVGFRGSILALEAGPNYLRATTALASTLAVQSVLLSMWLLAREPRVLAEILRAWRPSSVAGCTGALASVSWFLAFSLQSAAAVRTVGLLEILFAHLASRRLFAQRLTRSEALGIAMMMAGLALLLSA